MKIGFIGLGKLGLPCALAIEQKGHKIYGYDINPSVKDILDEKKLPYREEGAQELLDNHNIKWGTASEVISNSDIIFVRLNEGGTYVMEDVDGNYPDRVQSIMDKLSEHSPVLVDLRKVKERYDDILIIFKK